MIFQILLIISLSLNSITFAQSKPEASQKKAGPAAENPNAIMEKAENIRNPTEDYVCKVALNDDKNGVKDTRTYETSVKGRDKALVKFLTPVTEKGTKVLMVGQDMWVFVPTSAKPVRISANQKLTGNAAYGDVARLGFVGNYDAVLLREDKLDSKTAYVLDLTSKPDRPVTYDKVEYWVEKGSYRPMKAIYKTSSGKTIREGTFADFKDILGVQRPSKFILVNALQKSHTTTLQFSDTVKKPLADLLFEKQNMNRN